MQIRRLTQGSSLGFSVLKSRKVLRLLVLQKVSTGLGDRSAARVLDGLGSQSFKIVEVFARFLGLFDKGFLGFIVFLSCCLVALIISYGLAYKVDKGVFSGTRVLCLVRCCEVLLQGYQNKQRVVEKKVKDLSRLQGFLGYKKSISKKKSTTRVTSKSVGYFLDSRVVDLLDGLISKGVEFEVEPLGDHTFEVEPQAYVGQVAGSQEVQTQDLIDYHSSRDREQHIAQELDRYGEDSNEAAFAVAAVEKINTDESLTFKDTVACEVISKWKSGLKEEMDTRSDVYLLSNGCRKSSDDSDDYYCEYTPAKGNILDMEIIRDQSGNTLRGSQSRVHNGKLVQTLLEGHSILSLEISLSGDCDVEKNGKLSYTYAVGSQEYQMVCTRPDIASVDVVISLRGNKLNGSIPDGLFNMGLDRIDFSRNELTGSIPTGSSKLFETLQSLDLSGNQLTGNIPAEIGLNLKLRYLNLSWNNFQTRMPSELGYFQNLTVLDLRNGAFQGAIPREICDSGSLGILQLDGNSFTGSIPDEIGNCSSLYLL
ncbi:leucine-rich receptor-like protein kinase family protein [Artemisia annua]|uniref:Leucine-rich receptor-like protein kinase family protein n=1 Tax=Artemisia annua TaxID=35608 RepID=A0A2U1NY67_ARTAN|nr:leucine-rich receptor-like protein kinase family protein [Artemisia annua]